MEYNIRFGTENDLERITKIYNMSIEKGRVTAETQLQTIENRRKWFQSFNEKYPLYVMEIDNKVIGYIYLSSYRPGRKALDGLVEVSYYLDLDYVDKGLGSILLKFILEEAKKIGYHSVVAILLNSNTPSIKLLEKFNFQLWGDLPNVAQFENDWYNHQYYGLKLK